MITFPFGFLGAAAGTPFVNTYSVDFDGADDYVDSGSSMSALGFGSTNVFSVSFWVKCNSLFNWDGFIGATSGLGWSDGFGFWYQSDILKFFVNTHYNHNAQVAYAAASTALNWNHIVGVYDGTLGSENIKLYINGVVGGTTYDKTDNLSGTSNPFRIGKIQPQVSNAVNASFDEVALFSTALSSSDITAIYNSGTPESLSAYSPVLWYRMGDGDVYPMLNNEQAYSNRSVDFDGVDDYVDLGRIEPSTTALTISAWVYKTDTSDAGIVSKYASTDYGLGIWGTNLNFYIKTTSWSGASASFTGSYLNQWVHVCGTWDGTTITLYINGSSVATASKTGSISYSTNNTRIGDLEGAAGWNFDGNIDEVAIWGSALTSGNVTTIYNSGVPNDISALSPVAWWRMGEGDTYPTLTDSGSGSNDGTMTNMVAGDITGAQTTGIMTNMVSGDIVADVP